MRSRFKAITFGIFFWLMAGGLRAVEAAPRFTLTPATGNYTQGSNFSVAVGVNSESEKVIGMDVVGSFDATRLEIVSIDKAANAVFQFAYDPASTPIIHNESGTFAITVSPMSSSVYDGVPLNGALLTINFRAKAVGTAAVNFTCRSGGLDESNIINQASTDVIDCGTNQSGSYTIGAGGGDNTTPEVTVAATTTTPKPTIPQTGSMGATIGLITFGLFSIAGAFFLRWL